MNPIVSIIIPVYNIEKYIRQCLDSVIDQSLNEIEIIIVDDGSTDNSGKICDEYSAKDPRVRVLHKTNGGLSSARNDGIRMSTARYIMFIDGDDWVDSDFCESSYEIACENNADLVLFSYKKVYNDGTICNVEIGRESGVLTEEEALYYNIFVVGAVWVGLYSREIFDHEMFPDGKLHEDTATSHRFIHEAKRIYLLDKCPYNYRSDRVGSIMNDPHTKDHPDKRAMLIRRAYDYWNWGYKDFAKIYALRVLVQYELQNDESKNLKEILKTGKPSVYFDSRKKSMVYLYLLSPRLFDIICKITGKRKKLADDNS